MILIGEMINSQNAANNYADIMVSIFPLMITLSSSVELVCNKLFEKLLYQLIHWISAFGHASAGIAVPGIDCQEKLASGMLDTLIAGLGKAHDEEVDSSNKSQSQIATSSTADTCILALTEAFKWCLKYSISRGSSQSSDAGSTLPFSTEKLLSRLFLLAGHPNIGKRIGSALVLCRLYGLIRDEDSLVLKYILRITFILLNSLRQLGDNQEVGKNMACYCYYLP
jgi:hypothetical protein